MPSLTAVVMGYLLFVAMLRAVAAKHELAGPPERPGCEVTSPACEGDRWQFLSSDQLWLTDQLQYMTSSEKQGDKKSRLVSTGVQEILEPWYFS